MGKRDIRLLSTPEIADWLQQQGQPRFRTQQIVGWLWQKGVHHFHAMTDLPKSLRLLLEEHFEIRPLTTDLVQRSTDGTIKTRFKLHDNHLIEAVLIPVTEDERFTVCVSSQVGCSLTCKFCATGRMGRKRNLDPGEIYDQVLLVNRQSLDTYGQPLSNIVFMGMGEPLLTYNNVIQSIHRLTSPNEGLGMSPRRITVSTAGIAKMIKKLADDNVKFNLALSLHAADDVKRNEIMPINETNNLTALTEALQYFHRHCPDSKITFEYIAFQRFNDTIEDARQLVALCKQVPAHVNIIEYNPIDGADYIKSDAARLNEFARFLAQQRINVTVRRSRGKDIDAACGQLANKV